MLVPAAPPAPVDPCHAPALHLACPNLVMPAATNLEIKRTASGRRLLMMDNYLVNVGPGRVQFRGHRTERYRMEAVQLVDRTGGRSPIRFNTGATLTWKYVNRTRGNFWKFRNAARFELWSMDAGGHRARFVNASPKLDYCLRDLFRRRTFAGVPFGPYFGACSQRLAATTVTLGISVGWADGYPYDYPDNDIDVTGLRGCFVILQRADPLNHVLETNDNDNTSHLTVRLPYHAGRQGCPRYRGLAR